MYYTKSNAPVLNSRKVRTSLRDSLLGFQDFLYHTHSCRMCILILIGEFPHRHAEDSLEKNLSLYSPIGA